MFAELAAGADDTIGSVADMRLLMIDRMLYPEGDPVAPYYEWLVLVYG